VSWAWTARKWAVSAFVLAHLFALVVWNLPSQVLLRQRLIPTLDWYMQPTGLWQDWGMFAPDPGKASVALEAVTVDRHGVLRTYTFPKLTGLSVPAAAWRFRHAKYASVIAHESSAAHREFAARTVLRRLDIDPRAYPVDVQLLYRMRETPPPGEPPAEGPGSDEPTEALIATFRFPNRAEVDP
jgi:hypothetical protein